MPHANYKSWQPGKTSCMAKATSYCTRHALPGLGLEGLLCKTLAACRMWFWSASHLELVYQNEDVDLVGEAGDRGHNVQELLRGAQLLKGPAVALEGSQLILFRSNLQQKQACLCVKAYG